MNDELNEFDLMVGTLNNTLGNVSSLALAGGRLKRLQKAQSELDVRLKFANFTNKSI